MELFPCIVQDARTGEVLTLAYVNDESLARTRETGEMWFWSRSRDKLWHKGETSGNVQRVRAIRYDCDSDAYVALVDPAGPAGGAHPLPPRGRGPRPRGGPAGVRAQDRGAPPPRPPHQLHRRASRR